MNAYQAAIEIVSTEQDWKALVLEVAKNKPQILVDAQKSLLKNPEYQWHKECRDLCSEGRVIPAIRLCREKTGFGLKEAKEFCEKHFPDRPARSL